MMCLSFPDSTDTGSSSNSYVSVNLLTSVILLCSLHCHKVTVSTVGVNKQRAV